MVRYTEQSFFVMAALAQDPLHGYGIAREVENLSNGAMRLGTGTLYGVLDRLTASELIVHDRDETVEGRLRRYYRLTSDGLHLLGELAQDRRTSAEVTLNRLQLRRGGVLGADPA